MISISHLLCLLAYSISIATANVEKTIFRGPKTIRVPSQPPTIADLQLDVLTPEKTSLRTHLRAAFPTDASDRGLATWFLLDDLKPGQRYEARLCWAATQPTAFRLQTHEIPRVWDTPELITSLSEYSTVRLQHAAAAADPESAARRSKYEDRESSVLLLQITAAADYFTNDAELMKAVPPVYVDVILDPYLFNLVPRSLLPTLGYTGLVAGVSWLAAQQIATWLRGVATSGTSKEKKVQ